MVKVASFCQSANIVLIYLFFSTSNLAMDAFLHTLLQVCTVWTNIWYFTEKYFWPVFR